MGVPRKATQFGSSGDSPKAYEGHSKHGRKQTKHNTGDYIRSSITILAVVEQCYCFIRECRERSKASQKSGGKKEFPFPGKMPSIRIAKDNPNEQATEYVYHQRPPRELLMRFFAIHRKRTKVSAYSTDKTACTDDQKDFNTHKGM